MTTVSNGEPTRKDTNMKLLYIFVTILALTVAEEEKQEIKEVKEIEDSEAEASNIEFLKEGVDLASAASTYNYVPPNQRPQRPQWQNPQPGYPINTVVHPAGNEVQNDYYWGTGTGGQYNPHPPTTTPQVPVIKNEQYIGDNGDYKYEYQIGDGTHVGEQGWYTDPKHTEDSLVKKGWYSYVVDGKTYTVTYWADRTGFHAYGDHLPTPPPAPAAYPQNPVYNDYPTSTVAPSSTWTTPSHYHDHTQSTSKPIYYPPVTQPTYVPPHVPSYNPPQQPTYNPPQQPSYNPPQQPSYNPPQQPTYNPPQQPAYNPPQQPSYNPSYVPSYNQPQQPTYYPNYNV